MTTTNTLRTQSSSRASLDAHRAAPAVALTPQEANDRIGALVMTALVASFFAVVAITFWMASSVHV